MNAARLCVSGRNPDISTFDSSLEDCSKVPLRGGSPMPSSRCACSIRFPSLVSLPTFHGEANFVAVSNVTHRNRYAGLHTVCDPSSANVQVHRVPLGAKTRLAEDDDDDESGASSSSSSLLPGGSSPPGSADSASSSLPKSDDGGCVTITSLSPSQPPNYRRLGRWVSHVELSPFRRHDEDRLLLVVGLTNSILLLDALSGEPVCERDHHTDLRRVVALNGTSWVSNGASYTAGKRWYVYDFDRGTCLKNVDLESLGPTDLGPLAINRGGGVRGLAFSPMQNEMVFVGWGSNLRGWEPRVNGPVCTFEFSGSVEGISCLKVAEESGLLFAGLENGLVECWDLRKPGVALSSISVRPPPPEPVKIQSILKKKEIAFALSKFRIMPGDPIGMMRSGMSYSQIENANARNFSTPTKSRAPTVLDLVVEDERKHRFVALLQNWSLVLADTLKGEVRCRKEMNRDGQSLCLAGEESAFWRRMGDWTGEMEDEVTEFLVGRLQSMSCVVDVVVLRGFGIVEARFRLPKSLLLRIV